MTESSSFQNYSLSKLLIAMAIGIPTLGYVYYYYRKTSVVEGNKPKSRTNKRNDSDEETMTEKESSVEKVKEEGPLQRALSLKHSGNDFFKQRMYEEAIRCYTEALDLCPKEMKEHMATFYQNRAAAYEALNDIENVIKDCDEAIKLKKDYTKALTRRYKNLEKVGRLNEAMEDVTACCLLEQFKNRDSINAAERILHILGAEEAKKFQSHRKPMLPSNHFIKTYFGSYQQDPIMLSLSQLNGSLEGAQSLTGLDAAKLALQEERYEDILRNCNEEISKHSSDSMSSPTERYLQTLLLRASMYTLSTQNKLALEDFNLIIDAKPEDKKLLVNALLKRAGLYVHSENSDKALQDFNTACEIDPFNSDAAHQKAQVLLVCEKIPEALVEFERAIELNPKYALSLVQKIYAEYRKALMEKDTSKINSSKVALQRAVAKHPHCIEGYLLLGQVYIECQEFEEAESVFIQGTKADPFNASLLVHLGMLYLQWKGDIENAIKNMEKGIEIDPKCGFAYETLASVESHRGDLLRSISLYDKALMFSKSEMEAAHILSLKAAVQAQHSVAATFGATFSK